MKYCSHCRAEVTFDIPEGDNRHRHICHSCDIIFYENPRIVAGTLPVFDGRILLCKRAISPRKGYWTLPAGFMENGESTEQAALRETREEAEVRPVLGNLYSMITVPHINQVHIFFLADMQVPEFSAGPESLEDALFTPAEIPWDEIAFPTVSETLKRFIDGATGPHVFDIRPDQALHAGND